MRLGAADAAELVLRTVEAGGTAAVAVVVGAPDAALVGLRLALVQGPEGAWATHGTLGSASLDAAAASLMREAAAARSAGAGLHGLEWEGGPLELYLEVRHPVQELVVVGAGHVAQPVAHIGALLGFRVIVLDDRPGFATRERFPDAERLVRADFSDPFAEVPIHGRSHVLLVTRGHKYDYDCLVRALRADPPPAYIGMIGSRRRVRATYVQLLDEGFAPEHLERIHAPVGLDIGAETPEEIAVAVAAELVKLRRGGSGASLRDVERVAERFFGEAGRSGAARGGAKAGHQERAHQEEPQ